VRFRCSEDVSPQENLLFKALGPAGHNGIFTFRRLDQGWATGEEKVSWPGRGRANVEIRIYFRLSAQGRAWIGEVSMTETDPEPPRWVRVACTSGKPSLRADEAVLNEAGRAGVDLVLLPEYMQGGRVAEPLEGPSYRLMSAKAKQYRMYVAGGVVRKDKKADRVYNTALLLDREGKLVGTYDKIHPYSPEINEQYHLKFSVSRASTSSGRSPPEGRRARWLGCPENGPSCRISLWRRCCVETMGLPSLGQWLGKTPSLPSSVRGFSPESPLATGSDCCVQTGSPFIRAMRSAF
jgi:hypothetical protein